MFDYSALSRELRYGCPAADQILVNRYYTVGYSYYFRQAKWALEIVDPDKEDITKVTRKDHFRPDYRIPERFRANLSHYEKEQNPEGFVKGHLVASANQNDKRIQSNETFLLSNVSPQHPNFNSEKWLELEEAVRELDKNEHVLETYVITGPIFDFTKDIKMIGKGHGNNADIPVPSHFYKCILVEKKTTHWMWAFEMPNEEIDEKMDIADFRCSTAYIEQRAGILLWSALTGEHIDKEKKKDDRKM